MNSTLGKVFVCAAFLSAGCSTKQDSHGEKAKPATVTKPAPGVTGPAIIELMPEAKSRLGIESLEFVADRDGNRFIPVSALLYDNEGIPWIYVESPIFTFHREKIELLKTRGNGILIHVQAETPLRKIVTVGAAELSGIESGVGK